MSCKACVRLQARIDQLEALNQELTENLKNEFAEHRKTLESAKRMIALNKEMAADLRKLVEAS